MQFDKLCQMLNSIVESKRSKKSVLLVDFMKQIQEEDPDKVFSIIRLLVPKLDKTRDTYKMKEPKIARAIIRMLGLPPGTDKDMLQNASETTCNFDAVVLFVVKKYIVHNSKTDLTIDQLNTCLDMIACRKCDSELHGLLMDLFTKCSSDNIKWIIRIILKDLKLGIDSNSILNCYHTDAVSFYSANSNLQNLCETLIKSNVKLHEMNIKLFVPFRPMLSKRCDKRNFKTCFLDNSSFYVENKFDGERFQIHMVNNEFRYYSRNGFDFTEYYGNGSDSGTYTSHLVNAVSDNTKNFIVDGEMMLWDKVNASFGSKGMKYDVKKLKEHVIYQPCFCAFDILYYNGQVLTDKCLEHRAEILRRLFCDIPGVITVSTITKVTGRQEIVDLLNKSVDKQEEGLVIKCPKSLYKCGKRNGGWYKLKLEFFDDVLNDMDVIVMGGSYGSVKGKIQTFFIGILSDSIYLSFCKISSGLNDAQINLLNDKFKMYGRPIEDIETSNGGTVCFGREKPHVYIEPKKSCLLTIRASELIRTTDDHVKTPYTLRFPRVLAIRSDKPVDECFTMNDLLELTTQNKTVIKLNKRHIELEEIISTTVSKRRRPEIVMPKYFLDAVGDFFQGYKFYVLSGTKQFSRDDVYDIIKTASGTITYQQDHDIDIVIVGNISNKTRKQFSQFNDFFIIKFDWINRCIQCKRLLPFTSFDIVNNCKNFKASLNQNFDFYGDSYVEYTNKQQLQQILKNNENWNSGDFLNVNNTISIPKSHKYCNLVAYFDKFDVVNDLQSNRIYNLSFLDEIDFRFYGGQIVEIISDTTKINIIFTDNVDGRKTILENFLNKHKNFMQIENIKIESYLFLTQ